MDDVPAGPASPEPRRPSLSVVVPVRNGGFDFERCLRGLRESTWTDYELIVVDDGSFDHSGPLAQNQGATVLRHERPLGPAAARNRGALIASAPLIFFLDADVVVHRDAIRRGVERFLDDPGLTALFGSYDDHPAAPGLVSQFRNLLHHHVHQQGEFVRGVRPVRTFWTGCGMIRRSAFLDFGGFDPQLYRRPAIEDIELGYRLTRAGHRIVLARDVLATHLKRWTLLEMIRTDLFRRGVPWMLLLQRTGTVETDLNVSLVQKICVAITGLMWLMLAAAPWVPALLGPLAAGSAAVIWLNRDFYRLLARRGGVVLCVGSVLLHHLYFTCCGLSVVFAVAYWKLSRWAVRAAWPIAAPRRLDPGKAPIPRPLLARFARRVTQWTGRPR